MINNVLSEQHPREQGLKLCSTLQDVLAAAELSEQHPREQGLKLLSNYIFGVGHEAFRATSKRTRIETFYQELIPRKPTRFQSNIQENKD